MAQNWSGFSHGRISCWTNLSHLVGLVWKWCRSISITNRLLLPFLYRCYGLQKLEGQIYVVSISFETMKDSLWAIYLNRLVPYRRMTCNNWQRHRRWIWTWICPVSPRRAPIGKLPSSQEKRTQTRRVRRFPFQR